LECSADGSYPKSWTTDKITDPHSLQQIVRWPMIVATVVEV
jgi:hypothetical protein